MGFELLVHPALGGTDAYHERHLYHGAARTAAGLLYRGTRRTLLEAHRQQNYIQEAK